MERWSSRAGHKLIVGSSIQSQCPTLGTVGELKMAWLPGYYQADCNGFTARQVQGKESFIGQSETFGFIPNVRILWDMALA